MPADDPTGRRFGEAASAYERGRPEYPGELVDWLLSSRQGVVVDLGAGTGKLTRALVGRARSVVAVEPDPVMRGALSQRLPGISVIDGTAEDLPLRDAYADAVVAGQTWHWVDPDRGGREVARVLRPGGVLGLIWNNRDEADPWVRRLSALLEDFGTSPDAGYVPRVGWPFGALETAELSWTNHVTVEAVLDMVASRSYVIALPPEQRAALEHRVRALAVEGMVPATGLVPVRYVTRGYRARRP